LVDFKACQTEASKKAIAEKEKASFTFETRELALRMAAAAKIRHAMKKAIKQRQESKLKINAA